MTKNIARALSGDAATLQAKVRALEHELSELRARNAKLEEENIRDALTGVLNRKGIMERLEHAYTHATPEHYKGDTYIGFIDIKGFKAANDTYGHDVADEMIVRLATHLKSALKFTDEIGRFGGDEFLLLLPRALAQGAPRLVERLETHIRAPYAATIADLDERRLVDMNLGLAPILIDPQRGVKRSLINADHAMYHSKLLSYQGTPRTCVFDPTLDYDEIRFDLDALRAR